MPSKNGTLSSSIGSVATLVTTGGGEGGEEDLEEVGRVGAWLANFDKLLADTLGVQCLLVSQCVCVCGGGGVSLWVWVCVRVCVGKFRTCSI